MTDSGIVYLDDPSHRRRRNGLGILGCLFSILGVFTFGLASPIGLGLSLLGMLRPRRGAATVGLVLGAMGSAFLLLWSLAAVAGVSAVDHSIKAGDTQAAMVAAVAEVEAYRASKGELPSGIDGNKLLIGAGLKDAWGSDFRYDDGAAHG
ncbi:MAG: hypothetical protein KDA41_02680, partial [Planctomycetales bacterium]|nr:hypothetical protein [Planctomycetales bacterium]